MSAALFVILAGCVTVPRDPPPGQLPVGLTTLRFADPVDGEPMEAAAFYPAAAPVPAAPLSTVGPWQLHVIRDVAVAAGRHPLVVLSHGHLGSRFGHHHLAEALARAGAVVVAPDHRGDSFSDGRRAGTEAMMLGRPRQASAALDAVLADPVLGAAVEPGRVTAIGFSAGGYTALALAGAVPDFSLGVAYCQRHPDDPELCPADRYRSARASPSLRDARVDRVMVMAPLAVFFPPATLARVETPVLLAVATDDRVLIPEEHASLVERNVPRLVDTIPVEGAGHFVFLAPCERPAALCADPPGVDRAAVHRHLVRAASELVFPR